MRTAETRTSLAVGPGGVVAIATFGGGIRAWSLETHTWTARCSLPDGIRAQLLAWHVSGRYLASGNADETVAVWDMERETRVRLLSPRAGELRALAFSADGRWLAVACGDRTVRVYDVHGAEVRRIQLAPADQDQGRWSPGERPLGPMAFAVQDKGLVVATNDGRVSVLDTAGRVTSWWPHDRDVTALAVDGDRLATCADDGRLRAWDWSGKLRWRQDIAPADHVVWDGEDRLVVASRDGSVVLFDGSGQRRAAAALKSPPLGLGLWEHAVVTGEAAGQLQVWRV
jgi:WD40 repeat protein